MSAGKNQSLIIDLDGNNYPLSSMSGYTGGQSNHDMLSWNPSVRSADAELLPDMKGMVGRAHDMHRNMPLASGAAQIHVDNIIGSGLRLSAKPDYKALGLTVEWAAEWSRITEAKFRAFADDPACYVDAGRRLNFGAMQVLAQQQLLGPGEILGTAEWLPDRGCQYATAIQMVDPARLCNPNGQMDTATLRAGVELDRHGAAHHYHFRSALQSDMRFAGSETYSWNRVARETSWGRQQVIHLYEQKRPGQSRGVTGLATVIANSFKLDQLQNVTMDAAVLNAMYAAVLKTDMNYAQAAETLGADEIPSYLTSMVGAGKEFYGDRGVRVNGKQVTRLMPGDELDFNSVNQPGPNFAQFEKSFLRNLAAGWNLTYEQLARDYTQTNYSGARAGLMEAWKFFSARRDLYGARFASMVYSLWLEEAIDKGEVELPAGAPDFYDAKAAYSRSKWIGPGKGEIDPLKETKAKREKMEAMTLTYEDACAEDGKDWEENLEQIAREKNRMVQLGLTVADIVPAGGDDTFASDEENESDSAAGGGRRGA